MTSRSRIPSGSSTGIPQTLPAGGASMTEPPQNAPISYYKIFPNNPITFGWNLTSLFVTPTALTVKAFCPDAGNTYDVGALGGGGVLPGTATQVIWDLYEYQQQATVPLVVGLYQLQIFDDRGLGAVAQPGRFSPNTGLTFGIYTPGAYVPLETYQCVTCSAAPPNLTLQTVPVALVATTAIMFISGWRLLRSAFAPR